MMAVQRLLTLILLGLEHCTSHRLWTSYGSYLNLFGLYDIRGGSGVVMPNQSTLKTPRIIETRKNFESMLKHAQVVF